MSSNQPKSFLVKKTNLFKTLLIETEKPEIEAGELLFKIDKYAFTTNNITYGVAGFYLKYWDFFPAQDPWGIIPVWGFADVITSNHEGIKEGERFYGYFPMADYLKVEVGKVNPFGFTDMASHRQELSPIYNFYRRTSTDPGYDVKIEDFIPIFNPLFATSFLNYHFLKEEIFFGAKQIVLTSASSKTALALASLLKNHQEEDGTSVIGLTSQKNVEFVKRTAYYDTIISYKEVVEKLPHESTVIVDLAGNSTLLQSIYRLLDEQLKHISLIGITDWQAGKQFRDIPVAKFFFAPTYAQKMQKAWGLENMQIRLSKGLRKFVEDAQRWIQITYIDKHKEVEELYQDMLTGNVDPSKGFVVR